MNKSTTEVGNTEFPFPLDVSYTSHFIDLILSIYMIWPLPPMEVENSTV